MLTIGFKLVVLKGTDNGRMIRQQAPRHNHVRGPLLHRSKTPRLKGHCGCFMSLCLCLFVVIFNSHCSRFLSLCAHFASACSCLVEFPTSNVNSYIKLRLWPEDLLGLCPFSNPFMTHTKMSKNDS